MQIFSRIIYFLCICLIFNNCRSTVKTSREKSLQNNNEDEWINKAAKALFFESGGLKQSELEKYHGLDRSAIIENMMKDPRFIETIIDFNLFFIGNKSQSDTPSHRLQHYLHNSPAFLSGLNLKNNGDYFSLFDWPQPRFLLNVDPEQYQSKISQSELRSKIADFFNGKTLYYNLCNSIVDYEKNLINGHISYLDLFTPFSLNCSNEAFSFDPAHIKETINSYQKNLEALSAINKSISRRKKDQLDVEAIDPSQLEMTNNTISNAIPFFLMAQSLPNSLTNLNRKRAAYVLKTYFCDDLTPLTIAKKEDHDLDRHASDPACQACHYKLDPMAGFFKNLGIGGLDNLKHGFILFDNQTLLQAEALKTYQSHWRAPEGAKRTWDIGYIRSAKNESVNEYGESMTDLFKIIKKAPEAHQCLTRRLVEYTLGVDQIYDAGWIEELAQEFTDSQKSDAAPNASSKALKNVLKKIILSKTFDTPRPAQGQCYDFKSGESPETQNGPPCAVEYILKKYCTGCHQGDSPPKGLNLSKWVDAPEGKKTFLHIDQKSTQQKTRKDTFNALSCSISPNLNCKEGTVAMPMDQDFPENDRAILFKWIQEQLGSR